jgi:hypothetical protein
MKPSHTDILSRVVIICLGALMVLMAEAMIRAQTLPPDVGLITKLSGNITYWNEDYQKPAKAQSFMKIRRGDRFKVPAGTLVQFVYFLGGRQETWKGPVAFRIGDSESYPETEKGVQAQPKVVILPAGTTQGMRRIPVLLRRAGFYRPGAEQIRGGVEVSPAAIALTAEEQAEIMAAKETYRNLRKQIGTRDITPELFLLGVLADYEQYDEMEGVIKEALKREPGNDILKGLREWVHTQSSQGKSPSTR